MDDGEGHLANNLVQVLELEVCLRWVCPSPVTLPPHCPPAAETNLPLPPEKVTKHPPGWPKARR